VSNRALSRSDIDSLLPKTVSIIERPNIGYDFGGYQDAIRHIGGVRGALDQLILVNDSTWFPMAGSRDWIDSVALLGVDFAGAASNLGLAPLPPDEFRSFVWSYATDRPQFHYCSYALSFGKNILRDNAFWAFWDRLQITNDKVQTVRCGEVALSQLLISRGHSHGATLVMDDLKDYIETMSDERLLEMVRALVIPQEPELSAARAAFLAISPTSLGWRTDAVKFILNAIARTGISYALPELTLRDLGFPFLKKSPLVLEPEGCRETLRIIRTQPAPIADELLAEAQQMMGRDEQNVPSPITQVAV
jgi:lipopolysaccharide biosynthesis protein